MANWQYMAVVSAVDPRGGGHIVEIDHDGYQRDMGQDSTIAATITRLNKLGAEGWEVVSVTEHLTGGPSRTATYLLKRPA